jgi:hypothetical protein
MDVGPWIVLVLFLALIAFSMASRTRPDDSRPRDMKPPGEPGDSDPLQGRFDV